MASQMFDRNQLQIFSKRANLSRQILTRLKTEMLVKNQSNTSQKWQKYPEKILKKERWIYWTIEEGSLSWVSTHWAKLYLWPWSTRVSVLRLKVLRQSVLSWSHKYFWNLSRLGLFWHNDFIDILVLFVSILLSLLLIWIFSF